MHRGDIVLVPFPFTDLSGQKVRPALVLYVSRGEDCVVVFISSKPAIRSKKFEIMVQPSPKNGLKFDSIIKLEKMATLQKKIVIGRLGTLEDKLLKATGEKLKRLFTI